MQQNLFRKHKVVFLYLLLSIFSVGYAQDNPLVLSWDKLGCQQDTISKVNFDANFSNLPCLKVCKSAIVTYKISGEFMENVDYVKWYPTGGQKLDERDLAAMPIMWDNEASTGSLRILVVLLNTQTIEKTICVNKMNPSLILEWDKTGCQMTLNNSSELRLDNTTTTMSCLRVCEDSRITYSIQGDGAQYITSATWNITEGTTDAIIEDRQLSLPINWNNTPGGLVELHMEFSNRGPLDQSICIEKIKSSLLLDWEKIDESAIRQIKFDNNPNNPESIMAYPESTVLYKLDGNQLGDVESVSWAVTGGYAYSPNQLSTIITWEDAEENSMEITVHYKDNTTQIRKINIVNRDNPGGVGALNAVQFSYDTAGNQTRRTFIYLPTPRLKAPGNTSSETKKPLVSEAYDDITYYPNPVRSELFVGWTKNNSGAMKKIELFDLNGRMLITFPNQENEESININFEDYPTGVYELQLTYDKGEKKSLKVVKQ